MYEKSIHLPNHRWHYKNHLIMLVYYLSLCHC